MIPVQAAIGGKIVARESIKGFKKDVLTKYMAEVQPMKKETSKSKKRKSKIKTIWKSRDTTRSIHRSFEN